MDTYKYVILGGGMVAGYAAKELVKHGLEPGQLCLISADNEVPYERPPLSKGFLAGKKDVASILINDPAFYPTHQIEVRLNTVVERVELQNKRLHTRSGDEIGFDTLLIATGARVRKLDLPGAMLDGVLYLRWLEDSQRIRAQAEAARRAIVIGAGFIGLEVASVLAQKGLETTLLFPGNRFMEKLFTPEMSTFFQSYYGARGVAVVSGVKVASFSGNGRVSKVVLASGQELPTDLVVAGTGVVPATEVLEKSELRLEDGVVVNEYLETSVPDVYAAGDVANYYDVLFKKQRRVEHWNNAVEQGKHAARLLGGEHKPFVEVPYFFSDVFDLSWEFWGDIADADQVVHRGEVDSGRFSVWWIKKGQLVAAFVLNRPDEERELAPEWIKVGRQVSVELFQDVTKPLRNEN